MTSQNVPTEARVQWLAPLSEPRTGIPETADIVDEWGIQSFPASDPPANW